MKNFKKYFVRYPLAFFALVVVATISLCRLAWLAHKSKKWSDEKSQEVFNYEVENLFVKFVMLSSWAETGI